MKSRFITDPLDSADGFSSTAGAEFSANFLSPAGHEVGNPFAQAPVEIFYSPTFSAGPGVSSTPSTTSSNVVTVSSGGITFILTYDAAAMAAPSSFRATIEQAASMLSSTISDKITVNLNIDISGSGGGASAGPQYGFLESYSTIRSDLLNNASQGDTTFDKLPTGPTFETQSNVAVWSAQLKLFGFLSATDTAVDGTANFAADINQNLLLGVALHELTHALGRVPYGPPLGSEPDIFDFYRFTSPGNHLIQGSASAPAAYFSLDGGNTKLADFGQTSDSSDFLNSGVQGPNDPFNEFYTGSTLQSLTTADKQLLDALGFHVFTTTVIEAFGSTKLVQVGNNYFLDSISTGTGPELKYNGAPVAAGQFGPYTPVGTEATSNGYEVAWKNAATNQFSIWNTDSNGNFLSYAVYSGNSTALESLETSFQQDLNGDGVIGIPTTAVIESFGSTSLVQVGIHYFLNSVSSGTGPELQFNGAPVAAGQFGAYTLVAAEVTATGYEVAWKNAGTNQFSIWNTDSNGNFLSYAVYSGNSVALDSLETSFHQDLNGDSTMGVSPGTTVIELFGSTSLVQVGSNYFFDSNSSGGTGPELKYNGAPVVTGQFGPYTPVGVEATATGYELAWKNAGTNQFSIWNTDSNGNFVSYSVYSGTSTALESLETSFHQDLNGDGVIGVPPATAPSSVVTKVAPVTVANNDTFVFSSSHPSSSLPTLGLGAEGVANAGPAGSSELGGIASFANHAELAALFNDPQTGQPHAQFQWANDGHDAVIGTGNHDAITLINAHTAELHANDYIVR
jgi:serralysin